MHLVQNHDQEVAVLVYTMSYLQPDEVVFRLSYYQDLDQRR